METRRGEREKETEDERKTEASIRAIMLGVEKTKTMHYAAQIDFSSPQKTSSTLYQDCPTAAVLQPQSLPQVCACRLKK